MKLIHKKIPAHFLNAMPEGVKFIKKHQQDFLVVEKVYCSKGHNLMADVVRIHGELSINFRLQVGGSEGLVFLDAFWGGHAKLYNFIPDVSSTGPIVNALCPACGMSMIVKDKCRQAGCDSSQAICFALHGNQNKIYVCAKLGCPGHRMEIGNISRRVLEQVSEINYVGVHADDIFMEI
ncbi:MAG: hypothetical protein KKE37_07170 [Verrucomicrobia bacterium]|nr:hypothetical protein [Verrucomicrobiota bacterium]MBU4247025.1 hypothetical protein [Verrucomicrobiota bacterium]MBU4290325.1 hypothetical protein [Verrucomicrobiota bacterium]MBU4429118.1 hypothetical protein [Verrucomicrobiota bacterium]MCG2681775.1 hypothetical protein [Kiritimatiellia bacterium]